MPLVSRMQRNILFGSNMWHLLLLFLLLFYHGCNRRFNTKWLQKYPWLRYSPKLDAVLCGACALLMKSDVRQDNSRLVNTPFSNWVKLSDVLSNHSKLLYHWESLQATDVLRDTIQMPASRIDVMWSSSLQSWMAENSHILRQIVCAVLFLCKQGLALRGDVEKC